MPSTAVRFVRCAKKTDLVVGEGKLQNGDVVFCSEDNSIHLVVGGVVIEYGLNTDDIPEIVNGLEETVAGKTLDATQGAALKTLVDAKVATADIVNDLTTGGATVPLSAAQGVALKGEVDAKVATADIVNSLDSDATDVPLSAAQGKALSQAIGNAVAWTVIE